MARAYRCDSCNLFYNGRPYLLSLVLGTPVVATDGADAVQERQIVKQRTELCPDCLAATPLRIQFVLGGDPIVTLPRRP